MIIQFLCGGSQALQRPSLSVVVDRPYDVWRYDIQPGRRGNRDDRFCGSACSTSPRRGVRSLCGCPGDCNSVALPLLPKERTAAGRFRKLVVWWSVVRVEGLSRVPRGAHRPQRFARPTRELASESDGIRGLPTPVSRSHLGLVGPLSGHSVPTAVLPVFGEGNPHSGDYSPTRRLSAV